MEKQTAPEPDGSKVLSECFPAIPAKNLIISVKS